MLCTTCRTGKEQYKLDNSEPMCPYMNGYSDGNCIYYQPAEISAEKEKENK